MGPITTLISEIELIVVIGDTTTSMLIVAVVHQEDQTAIAGATTTRNRGTTTDAVVAPHDPVTNVATTPVISSVRQRKRVEIPPRRTKKIRRKQKLLRRCLISLTMRWLSPIP